MVDMDRDYETERDRGDDEVRDVRSKKTVRVRGSELERNQESRVARSEQRDSTALPGFTRWKNT